MPKEKRTLDGENSPSKRLKEYDIIKEMAKEAADSLDDPSIVDTREKRTFAKNIFPSLYAVSQHGFHINRKHAENIADCIIEDFQQISVKKSNNSSRARNIVSYSVKDLTPVTDKVESFFNSNLQEIFELKKDLEKKKREQKSFAERIKENSPKKIRI